MKLNLNYVYTVFNDKGVENDNSVIHHSSMRTVTR